MNERRLKIGSIVIRCYEFSKMISFWQKALGYLPRENATDDWVVLCDPDKILPNISLDRILERRLGKRSHIHLDLYTDNMEKEVERLISIGAKHYPWRYPEKHDYIVLEDPDGNLFCVVQKD